MPFELFAIFQLARSRGADLASEVFVFSPMESSWVNDLLNLLRYRLINLKFRSYTAPARSHVAIQ